MIRLWVFSTVFLFAIIAMVVMVPDGVLTASSSVDFDSLVLAAETAGREGKSDQAIRDYEQAAMLSPDRRDEISGALAFQYAWAGDLPRANKEFTRARKLNPDDYDLWMGQNLVTNWMGDHLTSWDEYSAVSSKYPDRAAPWVGLAASQDWAGRKDLALNSLAEANRLEPGNNDANNLNHSIRTELRPMVGGFYDWSEDSDDYQVNSFWGEAEFSPNPQIRLIPFLNTVGIRRPASTEINETWIGLTASTRPSTRLNLRGRGSYLTNAPSGTDFAPITVNGSAELTASDRVKFGGTFEHFAVVSFVTFPEKITGETYGAFIESRPDWLSTLYLGGDYAKYRSLPSVTDRWNFSARASRQVWAPIRLRPGISARYLDFNLNTTANNGIWTPDDFWAVAGMVEWEWTARGLWSLHGKVELGPAQESGGETTLFTSWSAGFFRRVGHYLVTAAVGHTEGNVDTWTGYDRSYAHLGLRRRF